MLHFVSLLLIKGGIALGGSLNSIGNIHILTGHCSNFPSDMEGWENLVACRASEYFAVVKAVLFYSLELHSSSYTILWQVPYSG